MDSTDFRHFFGLFGWFLADFNVISSMFPVEVLGFLARRAPGEGGEVLLLEAVQQRPVRQGHGLAERLRNTE